MLSLRRGSLPSKPPPPVRRSSSVTGASPIVPLTAPRPHEVTYASPHNTPSPHRRSLSGSGAECHYYPSTQSEHGTAASGSHSRRADVGAAENFYAMSDVTPTNSDHASVVETLNRQFAALSRADSVDDLPPPPMPEELSMVGVASAPSMLAQIRQGVQLRKVRCNDRSLPRVS